MRQGNRVNKRVRWSRNDKLGVAAVVIALVALVSAFVLPEARQFFGLEKQATVQAQAQGQTSAAPPAGEPQQTIPSTPQPITPKSQTVQHSTTKVSGDSNVAGNNVAGTGNELGNNNQASAPVVSAPNGIAINGGIVNNPTVNNLVASPSLQVKQESLTLAKDISNFIAQQRKAGTPPSWEEFIGSFGDRVASVSDELASAGLGDFWLQQTNKLYVSGDIAGSEQQVADKLLDLGTLLPQDGLYKGASDVQLAHAITEQADKLDAMSRDTLKRLIETNRTSLTNPKFIRYDLFADFNDCCRIAVKDLRGVALQRLPGAVDKQETRAFLDLMHMNSLCAYNPIREYVPYLRHLAEELQTRPQN